MNRFFRKMQGIHLILIPVVIAISFTSCENKLAISAAEKELEELKARYLELEAEERALAKERSEQSRIIRGGSTSFNRRLAKAEEGLGKSEEYVALLEEENNRLEKLLAEWDVAVKKSLEGRQIDRIVTKSGKELIDVVVKSMDDEKLEYTSKGGAGSEKLSNLTDETLELLLHGKLIADRVDEY